MVPALYDDQRALLTRLSWMLCCASIAVMPFLSDVSANASAASAITPKILSAVSLPGQMREGRLQILRDPFVSEIASTQWSTVGSVGDPVDSIGVVLPPNNAALGLPNAAMGQAISVRAVVLGKASRALVDAGGSVRVLGIGDPVAGSVIANIDASGIVLANGERIGLTEAAP